MKKLKRMISVLTLTAILAACTSGSYAMAETNHIPPDSDQAVITQQTPIRHPGLMSGIRKDKSTSFKNNVGQGAPESWSALFWKYRNSISRRNDRLKGHVRKSTSEAVMQQTGKTAEIVSEKKAQTISLKTTVSPAPAWSGFVIGGDSVILNSTEGTYVEAPAADEEPNAGGRTVFTLIPVKPGTSIVTFACGSPEDHASATVRAVVAEVDDDLNLEYSDVTDSGIIQGTVIAVNPDDHSVELMSDTHGKLIARFDANVQLPAAEEQIAIYTNGTMSASEPAIVNVLAWNSVPDELARDDVG